MSILDTIFRRSSKASATVRRFLPIVTPWQTATFFDQDFYNLNEYGYKNSAVFACCSALSFGFIEPPLKVYDTDDAEIPGHPTRKLITRPNDIMGEGELFLHTITYLAIGGNAYWHKIRGGGQKVIGLKPYHIGNISPIPSRDESWIKEYEYDDGTGQKVTVPKEDIVHIKWPSVDMSQPWVAMPPLLTVIKEIATDSEAMRYLKAVLQNDAVPRMVMYVPPESNLDLDDAEKIARFKAQFRAKYGGDNRGDLAVITGGARVERISLNLEELMIDSIIRIPESRIAAALRVPAILAGLNSGMERSTFNNTSEAREFFTRSTLTGLWKLTQSEIEADADLNPNGDTIRFDLSEVKALQENEDNKWKRLTDALNAGGITINDFRKGIGLPEVIRGNIFLIASSVVPVDLDSNEPVVLPTTAPAALPAPAAAPEPVEASEDEPAIVEDGKGKKESAHAGGEWIDLMCPICGNVGVNVFDDHKGLAVCPACTCTFDPELEEATIGKTNGNR